MMETGRAGMCLWALVWAGVTLGAADGGARQGARPPSLERHGGLAALSELTPLELEAIEPSRLLAEDARATPGPLRFAAIVDLAIEPGQTGDWETLADGARLWRLRVVAPGSTDLNFGFTRFVLPAGASLWVWSEERDDWWEGPYTADDNEQHGQLWTPPVPGERAVIELLVPAVSKHEPELLLGRVGRGYRDLLGVAGGPILESGPCNNDVVCPEGEPWRPEIRSVAGYSFGGGIFCTGTLLADVPGSLRPFFLTANHCGMDTGNAPSMVVFWNFQTSTCGGPRDGQRSDTQTGATWLAGRAASDFALLELDDQPSPGSRVYFSGWDRSGTPPAGSVSIHHPNGDEKAISFNDDALYTVNNCIGPGANTHWEVDNWEDGTTEPGSSGGGIWDADTKQLVGTLSGGLAACGNQLPDCYGKFSVHWDAGNGAAQQLAPWLDPGATGVDSVPGIEPPWNLPVSYVSHTGADACSGDPTRVNGYWEPGETITLDVSVEAYQPLSNLSGTLTTTTPGVSITTSDASWGTLAAGERASAQSPFELQLDEGYACLEPIDFSLELSADQGGPWTLDFAQDTGRVYKPAGPVGIVDGQTVASPLDFDTDVTLTGLKVQVDVQHSWVGDLTLVLRSPGGQTVTLLDRPGVPSSQYGCGDNDMLVVFDDAAGMTLENHCAGTTPWYQGDARPQQGLAALLGGSSLGTWRLEATDAEQGDSGTIRDWRLLTTPEVLGECGVCSSSGCPGEELAPNQLKLTKAAGGRVRLVFPGPTSGCAVGTLVWQADTPRPVSPPGSFPSDPLFTDITAQDEDPGAEYVHPEPAGNAVYLVTEELPGGLPGPAGRY